MVDIYRAENKMLARRVECMLFSWFCPRNNGNASSFEKDLKNEGTQVWLCYNNYIIRYQFLSDNSLLGQQ